MSKAASTKKKASSDQGSNLMDILKNRFEKNMKRHKGIDWSKVEARLRSNPKKLANLEEMESSGGEPDVIGMDKKTGAFIFCDCSQETPKGRVSLCYDLEAWKERKEHRPKSNAMETAEEMGIELLTEEEYFELQKLGPFDTKTSSWLKTPAEVRKLGGALFGDYRFGRVFIYHNGAQSYYAARGFRGKLSV